MCFLKGSDITSPRFCFGSYSDATEYEIPLIDIRKWWFNPRLRTKPSSNMLHVPSAHQDTLVILLGMMQNLLIDQFCLGLINKPPFSSLLRKFLSLYTSLCLSIYHLFAAYLYFEFLTRTLICMPVATTHECYTKYLWRWPERGKRLQFLV